MSLLERLEELEKKATKGPWTAVDPHYSACGSICTPNGCHESHPSGEIELDGPPREFESFTNPDDCILIAETRNALPALLTAIKEMRGALEEVARPINGEDVESLTQLALIVGLKQREAKITLTKVSKMLEG